MDTTRICTVCQQENPANSARCLNCGSPLDGKETARVARQWMDEVLSRISAQALTPPPGTFALQIVGRAEPILIEAKHRMVLGRFSPGAPPPDINLNVFQASLQGVSRQHAAIVAHGRCYFIEDLGSTNGTWINENRLNPHEPHQLASGDLIRLGQFVFFIHFS